ncbi:MAG: hypothetical protein KCHDKBKB_01680 [Elusimicrobia bacterium]|nr:hypothetical protein [Elusimicrobiota bacterium]
MEPQRSKRMQERDPKHSYPTLENLSFLLEMIHNRDMALPDFQRDFVWDPYATEELIESIISNFPAGTLLRIKNGSQLLFRPRAFAGAPEINSHKPAYLILDGQQRLTSLYQAFYGQGDHRYYIDLGKLEQKGDLEDSVFFLKMKDGERKFGTTEQQAASLVFPLARLFGVKDGFSSWQNQIMRISAKTTDAILTLQERLAQLHKTWIKPLEDYEFPMVTLNEDTSGEAVCTIFETLNRTGVKLSVFDLLTARFWPADFNLRDKWERALNENPIIKDFEIDPYYVLQTIALLEPGVDRDGKARAPSIKRGVILNLTVAQAKAGWDQAIGGLSEALTVMRDDCGVLDSSLLPYNTIVIPMASVFANQKSVKGAQIGGNRLKITRWFWCSVFGQKYENAPNSQAEKDYGELTRWMSGGQAPESVRDFKADWNLRQTTPRQRAVYRGVMALILQNGALDFHKRGRITPQLISDKRNPVDDHHIFPQAYLNERNISSALRDSILNRTYIDRTTNQRLSKRAPSDYFTEIAKEHGQEETDALLKTHLLPASVDSPLLKDDFEGFLTFRENAIQKVINRVTSNETRAL